MKSHQKINIKCVNKRHRVLRDGYQRHETHLTRQHTTTRLERRVHHVTRPLVIMATVKCQLYKKCFTEV